MCGVGGIIAPHSTPEFRSHMMDRLLLAAQERGDDATGICFVDPKRGMVIVKDGKPASKFVYENEDYLREQDNFPAIVLGHCRAATKGRSTGPEQNKNNHPFFAKEARIAMIHNGLIADDEKWRESVGQEGGLRNKPESDVDSEVMVCAVETFYLAKDKDKRSMEEAIDDACYTISGNYVLGFLKEDEPNKAYFVKHDNPLCFGWIPKEKAIIFASTEKILKNALERYKEHLGYFIETYHIPVVTQDAKSNTLTVIEIMPEGSKAPFQISEIALDVATNDSRARTYIEEEETNKQLEHAGTGE